jgi:Flp pilus assembly protein TadB
VPGLSDLLAQAQFLDPGRGPEQSGDFRVSPRAFVAILVAGFLIGTVGHVLRSRALVAFGIALIFGATVAVPVVLALAN